MAKSPLPQGGYSVFHETMADMTAPEIERAAKGGAVALWALGVIEQHGPHLPLATDVYVPQATLRAARRILASETIESVIVPPFYWGVNHVTGRFPGSIEVRPEVMVELMADVLASLAKDGFARAFCLSGHGDRLHNRTILEGVRTGCARAAIDARMVVSPEAAERFGFDAGDPRLALTEATNAPPTRHPDVHAGDWETSLVWALYPRIVRTRIVPTLAPSRLGPADLAEWRKGQEHARRVTPVGYFGDPAAASPDKGAALLAAEAARVAQAIARAIAA